MIEESGREGQLDGFECCFSYSPNWYAEQSIALDAWQPLHLYYASNHLLYLYNMQSRRVEWQLSAKLMIKQHLDRTNQKAVVGSNEFKTMKLFCVYPMERYLVLGLNDGIVVVADRQLHCKFVYRVKIKNITNLLAFETEEKGMAIVLFDQVGMCVKLSLKEWQVERLEVKISQEADKRDRLKKVVALHDQYYCFYQRGAIYVTDLHFDKQIRRLTYSKTDTILHVANFQNRLIVLTKDKEALSLCFFEIEQGLEFALQHTKTVYEITKKLKKCQIEIEYPKKYMYKKEEMKKASLCVEWLGPTKFILTGRLAEIYVFDMERPPTTDKLVLKPFSMEEENPCYTTLPQSHHFDEIYQLYRRGSQLLSVGTDRTLNFWNVAEKYQLRFDCSVKFLGSSVRQIILPQSEKSVAVFLMGDSIIRSWDMAREENQNMLAEYWKAKQKMKIVQMCCHPKEDGLAVLLTDDNCVVFYDLYEERQVRMQKLQTLEQCSMSFIPESAVPELCAMFESELQPRKLENKQYWKRNIESGHTLMVELGNSLLLINPTTSETFSCRKYFRNMGNNEKVEKVRLVGPALVAYQRSPTRLLLKLRVAGATLEYGLHERFANCKQSCTVVSDGAGCIVYLALVDKRDLQLCVLRADKKGIVLLKEAHLPYPYFLEEAIFSTDGNRLLAFSLLNSTLQLWELNYSLEDKLKPIGVTSKNIQAHFGNVVRACFFRSDFAISCSHDQVIKIWDLRKCVQRKPPKAKNHKKKKGKKQAKSIDVESQPSSGGEQQERPEIQPAK